jgi:REP element-mobilizing transposase RayT
VHLTLRATRGLPSLRSDRLFSSVRLALVAARGARTGLRVVHFSVQSDHLHLIVEAPDRDALCRGAKGLAVRLSHAINRTLGRTGRVWGDRYHVAELDSPRQVRHALVYVFMNFKKHIAGSRGLDPRSSAALFDGWDRPVPTPAEPLPLHVARTWLLARGWRRHGLISIHEAPAVVSAS